MRSLPSFHSVDEQHLCGERSPCHDRHLDGVLSAGSSQVRHQLELPEDDAGGKEEEETGEKDREEDKKVDVKLVLAEEYVSQSRLHVLSFGTMENEVEFCGSQVV